MSYFELGRRCGKTLSTEERIERQREGGSLIRMTNGVEVRLLGSCSGGKIRGVGLLSFEDSFLRDMWSGFVGWSLDEHARAFGRESSLRWDADQGGRD